MRRSVIAVVLLLFGIYMLTASGHFYAVDEERMFEVMGSLARYGSFALNPEQTDQPLQYSQYGPGQSVIALPWYYLGRLIAIAYPPEAESFVLRAVAGWFNPLITASVAGLLVLAAQQLGYRQRSGVIVALLYGLATTAWPHSKTFFAEPLVTLLLFGSFLLSLQAARVQHSKLSTQHSALLFFAGLLVGIAPTVKIQSAIFLPILGLWVLYLAFSSRRLVPNVLAYGAGAAIPLALLALYQWQLFGSPLRTGYGGSVWEEFSTPFWEGFAGLLISPGRGIFWYAPITLLVPLALWLFARRHMGVALVCGAISLAHLLFYATWIAWDGAGAWGPRFLNTALPFMLLPFVSMFDDRQKAIGKASWLPVVGRRLAVVALLATLPVQFAGLSININAFFAQNSYEQGDDYQLSESALVGHWAMALRQLQTHYEVLLAPGVALEGVANTEGAGQLPRWALPQAQVIVRPPPARLMRIELDLTSCWMEPDPQQLTIWLDGLPLVRNTIACPARRYHLLLPARRTVLNLQTTGWRPAEFGIEKAGELGVYLNKLSVSADGTLLPVYGYRLPITPMPESSSAQRRWAGDHRYGHWDFWWWYLYHSGWPVQANMLFAALWLALALGSLGMSVLMLRGKTFNRR